MNLRLRESYLVACLTIVVGCDSSWSDEAIQTSTRRGDSIVAALNRYFADHGRYPDSLTALVPTYIAQLQPPTAGERAWRYDVSASGDTYGLWFGKTSASRYPKVAYVTSSATWMVDE